MRTIDTTLNDAFGQRQVSTIYNPLNQYRVVMELAPPWLQSRPTLAPASFSRQRRQVPLAPFARPAETTNTPLAVNHQGGSSPPSTISFNLARGSFARHHRASAARRPFGGLKASTPAAIRGSFQGTARPSSNRWPASRC